LFAAARTPGKVGEISPSVATSALVLRMGQAALIPLLPWLALVLAIPPVRSTSAIGIGAGLVSIIGYTEGANMVVATAHPILGMSALLALIAAFTGIMLVRQRSQGLDVATRGLLVLLRRRRRVRLHRATVHHLIVRPRRQAIERAA
jgi:hypothetical protein